MVDKPSRNSQRGTGLTPGMIEALKRRGYNQSQIATMYNCTRQWVSLVKHQVTGFSRTPRERARDIFPFSVTENAFRDTLPNKMLRNHAEYAISGGTEMSEDQLLNLRRFYTRLQRDNHIIEFDPNNPPTKEVGGGGYRYAERTEEDDDYLVRFNGDVDLTDEQKSLWRFPPVWPEV